MSSTFKDNLTKQFAAKSNDELLDKLNFSSDGLTKKEVETNRDKYGRNNILNAKHDSILYRLKRSFVNPYSTVLFILALISIFTDIVFAEDKNYTTVIIISTMLIISGIIRFTQEMKSKKVTDNLISIADSAFLVKRDNAEDNVKFEDIVVGDIIYLHAGERVPADIRILDSKDLFVSQSMITGESKIDGKDSEKLKETPNKITDYKNTVFQGTTIVGGNLKGIVLDVGENTVYGDFSNVDFDRKNGFDRGSRSIIGVLIKFMLILVPLVFLETGFLKDDWLQALLFSLSVAVGLTPELLPMVITACLSKGSFNMLKKETVVKNINAMEEFGSMDVLCVDKTGTLTENNLVLEYYLDVLGNENTNTLDCAYLSSYFSTGVVNPIDESIKTIKNLNLKDDRFEKLEHDYEKIDEFPFDYERKISSVLVKNDDGNILISKGPIDSLVPRCKNILYKDEIIEIEDDALKNAHAIVDEMLEDGMKVLAVATKKMNSDIIFKKDEYDMTLLGYIVFFDSPKKSAYSVLLKLQELNVNVKVLTGDNKKITASVCERLKMDKNSIITGPEFEELNDDVAQLTVENTQIFCELTPKQKAQIISMLESNGHRVGFLGDGMNDLPAMMKADVSISLEKSSSSLKEAADVILLKKDLNVIEKGILEGRKAFNNMSKYIKITASSNFGNILAIVIASIFLPFFPMTSIQLLLLNLLYDVLCLAIPWDNVDKECCDKPLEWSGRKLSKFMLYFGIISSVFDVITFAFLFYYLCPTLCGGGYFNLDEASREYFVSIFQTGWFLESMWTQVLIIHLLRSDKIPFVQTKPSNLLIGVTVLGIITFTVLAMTPLGSYIGLTSLPFVYFAFLILVVLVYLFVISIAKKIYTKYNKTLI